MQDHRRILAMTLSRDPIRARRQRRRELRRLVLEFLIAAAILSAGWFLFFGVWVPR